MTLEREAREALSAFALPDADYDLLPLAGGYINPTWRAGPLVLQRINPAVFPDPEAVLENVLAVAERLGVPKFIQARDGSRWHTAQDGSRWRAYEFVEGRTVPRATSPVFAEAAAHAFGAFGHTVSSPPLELVETLPGFHDTRARLQQLEDAAVRDPLGRLRDTRDELRRILAHAGGAGTIGHQIANGSIPLRIAHNDARIANVVFDAEAPVARCVIDLDTVMPGTPLHDFGDLVRSMASGHPDEAADPSLVRVRDDYFAAIVRGYLEGSRGLLSAGERALLVTAARSITLEQAARFLADHLAGDRYYVVDRPGRNLARARTQLAIFDDLTRRADALEAIVEAEGRIAA